MTERLTMITAPQSGGVMDYVHTMAEGLGADTRVLVFDKRRSTDLPIDGDCVLLHYSGYGFARYGAPLDLLWWVHRNRPRMKRFGVFFHEVFAQSRSPASSVFWLSPVQRYIAGQLARSSDFWFSNIELSTQWLARRAGNVPHRRLAIYSSVGELDVLPASRDNTLIVFGSSPLRTDTWRRGGDALFDWARARGIALHDIGAPIDDADVAAALQRHGVTRHGRLETGRIHALMRTATWGAVAYPPHYVAKSSVFAAYCAHGLAPLLLSERPPGNDGLAPGTHYLLNVPAMPGAPGPEPDRIGRAAFDWYQDHRIEACVQAIGALLRSPGGPGQAAAACPAM
jgi:hypothetical protein